MYHGYNLVQSTVRMGNGEHLFISTAHRECSTGHGFRYFETLIWRNVDHTPGHGKLVHSENSGLSPSEALARHERIIDVLGRRYARSKETQAINLLTEDAK